MVISDENQTDWHQAPVGCLATQRHNQRIVLQCDTVWKGKDDFQILEGLAKYSLTMFKAILKEILFKNQAGNG